jgi:murein DD-endopeptidase MepM/ murein hydrolase activator NlpD
MAGELAAALIQHRMEFASVLGFDVRTENCVVINFTAENKELEGIDLSDSRNAERYIWDKMKSGSARFATGGYNEKRLQYSLRKLFQGADEPRNIHLGIDLWTEAGTSVHAPLDGVVHSFQDNNQHGDYGPTIILEHSLAGRHFHTLYGHLDRECLSPLSVGTSVTKGQEIARIGVREVNGGWSPHLHFQVIENMLGLTGDFYGVVRKSERDRYLANCPDPNLILRISALE